MIPDTYKNISKNYPSSGQDWFNFAASYGVSNYTIAIVMELKDKVDIEILSRAVQLSINAEPILGCKFVADDSTPIFIRHENINMENYFSFIESDLIDEEITNYLALQISMNEMITVKLFRSSLSDKICIKLNHTCGDAGALKQYVLLLTDIYNKLVVSSQYEPEWNITGERNQKALFDSLGITNPLSIFNPEISRTVYNWAFPHNKNSVGNIYKISSKNFSTDEFTRIYNYGKKNEATINNLLLTSFFRSLFKFTKPKNNEPGHVQLTVDLRKYLSSEHNRAISNLSTMIDIALLPVDNESFIETLVKTKSAIKEKFVKQADIQSAIGCEYLEQIGFKNMLNYFINGWNKGVEEECCPPLFSNMGIISREPIMFGENTVERAYVVPPAFHAPELMLSSSFYNGTLNLMSCYYAPAIDKKLVDELIENIYSDLIKL